MFDRRLRMFFLIVLGMTGLLVLRAAQFQVLGADDLRRKAEDSLTKTQLIETQRGQIKDFRGEVLAVDEPCLDAVVDYRAIVEDTKWIAEVAYRRLSKLPDDSFRRSDRARRKQMQEAAQEQVRADLSRMWRTLAEVTGRSTDEVEEAKAQIRRKVLMRQRHVWYTRYAKAMNVHEGKDEDAWYKRWLLAGNDEPQLDSFSIEVSEQSDYHVIARDLTDEAHNLLKKRIEEFPGLDLRPGQRRFYPYGASAAHIIGTLAPVTKADVENDPNYGDELRKYLPNDRIGRSGVERLADDVLRGTRGRIVRIDGREQPELSSEPEIGKDVQLTIDIHLQEEIAEAFRQVPFYARNEFGQKVLIDTADMYGAAVVIDVATGQVRAMVSNPSFDLNDLDERYYDLVNDYLNRPLINRATQSTLVPGSTVKPIVGLGAITQGLARADECIECRGHLYINGKKQDHGRCWTVAIAEKVGMSPEHHPFPTADAHKTGHLNLADALQRSCNVYFETLGDRLRIEGLGHWYGRFGLGEPTGIGIGESWGLVPDDYKGPNYLRQSTAWFSAIGQSHVVATPLQMANVVATIARDGVWVRPTVVASPRVKPRPTTKPVTLRPDREDLHLSREALRMVHKGMYDAVNTVAGTGSTAADAVVVFAGKTGSAQVGKFTIPIVDENGNKVLDDEGRPKKQDFEISTPQRPNHRMRWYRSNTEEGKLSHAWFVGYAPAHQPRIAFAVMMEYGGSGGDCAPIVKALLEACVAHHYLDRSPAPVASR